jgi:hypothetical protein
MKIMRPTIPSTHFQVLTPAIVGTKTTIAGTAATARARLSRLRIGVTGAHANRKPWDSVIVMMLHFLYFRLSFFSLILLGSLAALL